MDEPRYTREEWEQIQAQEDEESQERARREGDLWYTLHFNGDSLRRNSVVAREALLDVKLKQARLHILEMIAAAADGG